MKLNLGAGDHPLDGYENIDLKSGASAYPLSFNDDSCTEVRASHLLEHFPHAEVPKVISEWVRVLAPHGVLKIAVPDFEDIAKRYLEGQPIPVEGFIMGGQVDADDYHKAMFDRDSLSDMLRKAGLIGISPWKSEGGDCSAYPISLNLQGYKRPAAFPKVSAVMSVPRLAFMDNYFCAFEALAPLKIGLRKHTGAYWGQCITRAIEETLEHSDPEYVLTIDYDSLFTKRDVESLLSAAMRHPDADAIAPIQSSRSKPLPMFTVRGEDGQRTSKVPMSFFDAELAPISTAHFGLTLLKAEALRNMPKPWFSSTPDDDGRWGEDRVDDDISFWHQWEKGGYSLHLANRIPIGHAELMVRWPGRDLAAIYQHPSEFWKDGKPEDIWK